MTAGRETSGTGRAWGEMWSIPGDVTYLNHGSFGPTPRIVQQVREEWSRRLASQPMQFFLRDLEPQLDVAVRRLAAFVGADASELVLVDNATHAMNVVAESVGLEPGDQVLLSDHEYGAVMRIWRRACERAGAELVVARLPLPVEDGAAWSAMLLEQVTDRTRLIVVSHVTSPTAVVLPVEEICRGAQERGVPVCIDGPHAVAMRPLDLHRVGCDYYAASCHKWLSAPFGSGFLYVKPRHRAALVPPVVSWGRSLGGRPSDWRDEFNWQGTREPASLLAIPAAIDFLESCGIDEFRSHGHELARYARERLRSLTGCDALVPDDPAWYGTMILMPLPPETTVPGRPKPYLQDPLQGALWERYRIEVPLVEWHGVRGVRVSCHLYNTQADIDRLCEALAELL